MKRFIHYDELARDSRFVRQTNLMTTILATLPDEVDNVVVGLSPRRMDPKRAQGGIRGEQTRCGAAQVSTF